MRNTFWKWLFCGINDRPGIVLFVNWWLLLHIFNAVFLAKYVERSVDAVAQIFLLPLVGILIGLSFAWAGNAQALLQTKEIEKFTEHHKDGIYTYIYTFQLAILVILITLVSWSLAGLGVLQSQDCVNENIIKFFLYFLASVTIRECWHVVLGSQMLILTRYKVREAEKRNKN